MSRLFRPPMLSICIAVARFAVSLPCMSIAPASPSGWLEDFPNSVPIGVLCSLAFVRVAVLWTLLFTLQLARKSGLF
eukprot:4954007-Amphidinium_carterae.1